MKRDLLDLASSLTRRGVSFVMATVVRREGGTPAHLSDMALVSADGAFHGWIGSKAIAAVLEREAMRVLQERRPCLLCLSTTPEREARPGVVSLHCEVEGAVEIYLAPMVSAPRLVLLGRSPISSSLAALARTIGYRVDLVDTELPASEGKAGHSADRVFQRYDDPRLREGDSEGISVMAVVSPGGERSERDADLVAAAVALAPVYLGVIASRRRFTLLRDALVTRGLASSVDRIAHPAGLALGANDPGEVAVGVLAQMIARRNGVAAVNEASVMLSETSEVTSTMDLAVDLAVDDEGRGARPGKRDSPPGGTTAATASCFPQPVPAGESHATVALRVRASSPSMETSAAAAAIGPPMPSVPAVPAGAAVPTMPSLPSPPSDGTPTVSDDVHDEAIDPVCQASVTISEVRHIGTWQGGTWYFCGATCRSKFLANPLRYSAFAPGTKGPGPTGTR
jgi:xanthine dehydrogenase accessory factor